MKPWDFPPEYGIEPGERCGRGRCKGRMIATMPVCECWTKLEEDEDGNIPETFVCTCVLITICAECDDGPDSN